MSVAGTWYSQVGSELKLAQNETQLTGTFQRAGTSTAQALYGSIDPDQSQPNQALSFSVAWFDTGGDPPPGEQRTVTSYTGQYHTASVEEFIDVVFLLANETDSSHDYASVCVGHDVFTRVKAV